MYNFTNPGAISHNEVLALYKKHVDPSYTWSNFTVRVSAALSIFITRMHACLGLTVAPVSPPPPTPTRSRSRTRSWRRGWSNNLLDTTKFVKALPDVHIPEIHEACDKVGREGGREGEREGGCSGEERVGRGSQSASQPVSQSVDGMGFGRSCGCQRSLTTLTHINTHTQHNHHDAPTQVFQRMRVNLEKEGIWPDKLPKPAAAAPPSS